MIHYPWKEREAVMMQPGFFDVDERLAALSAAGDPLERLSAVIDFELSARFLTDEILS